MCTANRCRSPMAAALLRRELAERGIADVSVRSAGLLPGGIPVADGARAAVPEVAGHVSRQLVPLDIRSASLVIAMERAHLREVAVLEPSGLHKTFTLKELARRAAVRRPGEDVAVWLDRWAGPRRPSTLLGAGPDDDVVDPIGRPLAEFRATAHELTALIRVVVDRAWAVAP